MKNPLFPYYSKWNLCRLLVQFSFRFFMELRLILPLDGLLILLFTRGLGLFLDTQLVDPLFTLESEFNAAISKGMLILFPLYNIKQLI